MSRELTWGHRPTADLALPGVTGIPMCQVVIEDEYLFRSDNAEATRQAITVFCYPKIGTRVKLTHPPRDSMAHASKGQYAWIIGYTRHGLEKNDNDFTVYVVYRDRPITLHDCGRRADDADEEKHRHLFDNPRKIRGYDYDGLSADWLSLDDGRRITEIIGVGKRLVGKCKYCHKEAPKAVLNINVGACSNPRCVNQSMRDNL